jgi:type IV pilus assembly protein PilW
MQRVKIPFKHHTQGFSLVEIMVGMTVGLLSMIIILQTLSVFENQKRTTTAGSDAQSNGLMAMVSLEQDIRNAGAGFNNSSTFDCTTINSYYDDGAGAQVPAPNMPTSAMSAIQITDGGATGSDSIQIRKATDFLGAIPATLSGDMPQQSSELNVTRTTGFVEDQLILVMQGGACQIMQTTNIQGSALKIQHNPGSSAPYNPSANCYNAGQPCEGFTAFATNAEILSLGHMASSTWSVNGSYNLQVASSSTDPLVVASTLELVNGIVSLQAQYGIADAGSQTVNAWVDATAATGWSVLDSSKVKRIKAIRVTLVARSGKKEISNVTAAAPGGVNISSVADWQKYRYRVYTTIIPLRNIIWANV